MIILGPYTQQMGDWWKQNYSPEAMARRKAAGEFKTRPSATSTRVSPYVTVETPTQQSTPTPQSAPTPNGIAWGNPYNMPGFGNPYPSQQSLQNPSPMTPASLPLFPQMPVSSVNAYEDRPRPYPQPRFNLRSPMAMRPNGFNFPSQFNIAPFRTNTLLDYDWTS